MNCLISQEAMLRGDDAPAAHLADCPACRELWERMAEWDRELSRLAASAELPRSFASDVLARIPARLSPAEIEARRRRVEAEHQAALARIGLGRSLFEALGQVHPRQLLAALGGLTSQARLRAFANAALGGITLALLLSSALVWPLPAPTILGLAVGFAGFLFGLRSSRLFA